MQQIDESVAIVQYIKAWTNRSDDLRIETEGPKLMVSNILDYSIVDAIKKLRKYQSVRCIVYSYSFGYMPFDNEYEPYEGAEFQSICDVLFPGTYTPISKNQFSRMLSELYAELKSTSGFEKYAVNVENITAAIKDIDDTRMLGSAMLLIKRDGSSWDLKENASIGERITDSVIGKIGSVQASAMDLISGPGDVNRVAAAHNSDAAIRAVSSEEWAEMSEALNSIGCRCENPRPNVLEVHLQDSKQISDATAILNNYNVRYELSLFTTDYFKADNTEESLMISAKILPGMAISKAIDRLRSIRAEDKEAAEELVALITLKEPGSIYSDSKLTPMLSVYAAKEEDTASLDEVTITKILNWAEKNHVEATVYSSFIVLAPMAILAENAIEYAEGLVRLIPNIKIVTECATLCGRLLSDQTARVLQESGVEDGMQAVNLCKKWLRALQQYDGGPSPKSTWVLKELLMNCKKMQIWSSKWWSLKTLLKVYNNRLGYNSIVICHKQCSNINPFIVPADMGSDWHSSFSGNPGACFNRNGQIIDDIEAITAAQMPYRRQGDSNFGRREFQNSGSNYRTTIPPRQQEHSDTNPRQLNLE